MSGRNAYFECYLNLIGAPATHVVLLLYFMDCSLIRFLKECNMKHLLVQLLQLLLWYFSTPTVGTALRSIYIGELPGGNES